MRHHKGEESSRLADRPCFIASGTIVPVNYLNGNGVYAGNRNWDFGVKGGIVPVCGYGYWRGGKRGARYRRRKGSGIVAGREFEETR